MKTFLIIISFVVSYGVIVLSGYLQMLVLGMSQMFNDNHPHNKVSLGRSFWITVIIGVAWIVITLWNINYFTNQLWVLILGGVGVAVVSGVIAVIADLK